MQKGHNTASLSLSLSSLVCLWISVDTALLYRPAVTGQNMIVLSLYNRRNVVLLLLPETT